MPGNILLLFYGLEVKDALETCSGAYSLDWLIAICQWDTKEEDIGHQQTNANLHVTLKCECLHSATVHLRTGDNLKQRGIFSLSEFTCISE